MRPSFSATPTIGSALALATEKFSEGKFENSDLEARVLLSGLIGCSTTDLYRKSDDSLSSVQLEKFGFFVDRRLKREPAAYILGAANFMGLDFQVNSRVLIPRPETELLTEHALWELLQKTSASLRILDVGTGCGCVAICLARSLPYAEIVAVDSSTDALEVARENGRLYNAPISFVKSDLLRDLGPEFKRSFDMIVSNPPYVASPELTLLEPELSFEPKQALDGGPDGLDLIRRLIQESLAFLKGSGLLVFEMGQGQGASAVVLLENAGFKNISVLKDHSGHERIAKGTFIGSI